MKISHRELPDHATVAAFQKDPRRVLVRDADGKDYGPQLVGTYIPAVGDVVALAWVAGEPYVVGKLGATRG